MMSSKKNIPRIKCSFNLVLMLMLWKTLAVPDDLFNFTRLVSEHNEICLEDDTRCTGRTDVLRPKYCIFEDYCATCQCDDNCFKYGDCCPDKLLYSNQRASEGYTCVGKVKSSTINPLPTVAKYAFYMIKTCPTDTPLDSCDKLKCYEDDLTFSILYPPVTVFETSITYKNQFCANCNGAADYGRWSVGFSCTSADVMNVLKTLDDISKLPSCAVYYIPDTNMPVRECISNIGESVCNVTGSWPAYDNFTYQACDMYKNIFIQNGIAYNNVFCFMCNSEIPPMPTPYCTNIFVSTGAGDVSGELNMDKVPRDWTPCSSKAWFDPYTKSCLNVHCSGGKFYDGERCRPIIFKAKGLKYKLTLYLNTEETLTLDENVYMTFHFITFSLLNSYFADFDQNFNLDRIIARNVFTETNSTRQVIIADTLIYYRVDLFYNSVENVAVEDAEALFLRPTEKIHIYLETINRNITLLSIKPENVDLTDTREILWDIAVMLVPKAWYIEVSRISVCTLLEITDFRATTEDPARLVIHGLHSMLTLSDVLNISNDTIHVCKDDYDVLIQSYLDDFTNVSTKAPTQTSSAMPSGTDLLNTAIALMLFIMLNYVWSPLFHSS